MSTSTSTPTSPLLDALEYLNNTVAGLEQALTKAEAKMKSGGSKRKTNQIDMFDVSPAAAAAVATTTASVDASDVAERLSRVIAQIEDVLAA